MSLPTAHGDSAPGPNSTISSSVGEARIITPRCVLLPTNGFALCSGAGKDRTPYVDSVYVKSLTKRGSHLAKALNHPGFRCGKC
jgi:hypothetical protein